MGETHDVQPELSRTVKTNAPNQEQRCPACCGLFTLGSASRKKKVQCPHCRALVTLSETAEVNGMEKPDAGAALAAQLEWEARCEQLQSRIETLEQQVEALLVAPRTQSTVIAGHNVSQKSRDPRLL